MPTPSTKCQYQIPASKPRNWVRVNSLRTILINATTNATEPTKSWINTHTINFSIAKGGNIFHRTVHANFLTYGSPQANIFLVLLLI